MMIQGVGLVLCLLAVLASVTSKGPKTWSYKGKTGPLYWNELFPAGCGGESQSPIDLKPEETMYSPDLKDFAIWYDPPRPSSKMYIKNTGYTAQVDLEGDFYVTNAGLGHVYKAAQFHFHWGHKEHRGSEHTVEGEPSPLELHVVTYNHEKHSDLGAAVREPRGLAVLGVLFEMSLEDNPSFDYVIRGLKQVRDPETTGKVELPLFSLRDMLPQDLTRYYRYNGSLTTPGCFESVLWSVFDMRQTISHKQLHEFRRLLSMKRRRHHSHHVETDDHHRQRRELTEAEKHREHNAKKALDELGIRGKDSEFEREALREQLINDKREVDDAVKIDTTGGDNVPQTDPEYVQDHMGGNFRPVQPLNSRIVYRSFRLRDDKNEVEDDAPLDEDRHKVSYSTQNGHGGHHGDGAGNGLHASSTTVSLLLLVSVFYTLAARLIR